MIECEIRQADFLDILGDLPSGSQDLILTDPPYAISRKTGFANSGKNSVDRFAVSMDFGEWDHKAVDLAALAEAMFAALRKGGTAIVWYDVWKISHLCEALTGAGFVMPRLIIWEKTNPVPLNMKSTYLSNARETAVCAVKQGKPVFNSEYHSGVYSMPIPRHGGKRVHPTQKPLQLFSDLIEIHSRPGDNVCDPFLGSGTTAVAAVACGRNFVGGDIDGSYAKIAESRTAEILG